MNGIITLYDALFQETYTFYLKTRKRLYKLQFGES